MNAGSDILKFVNTAVKILKLMFQLHRCFITVLLVAHTEESKRSMISDESLCIQYTCTTTTTTPTTPPILNYCYYLKYCVISFNNN